jgi:hypothetical protein
MTAEPEQADDGQEWTATRGESAHLRRVTQANTAVRLAQAELRDAVEAARKAGCGWDAIATALGTTADDATPDIPSIRDIVQTVLKINNPAQRSLHNDAPEPVRRLDLSAPGAAALPSGTAPSRF